MPPDNPSPEQVALSAVEAEFRDAFRELCKPGRYGWRRTQLSFDQLEYILDRHKLLEAIQIVQRLDPVHYTHLNKDTTMKLREHALHALASMAQAMAHNEKRFLYPSE